MDASLATRDKSELKKGYNKKYYELQKLKYLRICIRW